MLSLSDPERAAVLHLAREAVTQAVVHGHLPADIPSDGIFSQPCGVFVTLHVANLLRGCIGVVEPSEPFGESVVRCAASAALQDPRFPVMRPQELPGLHIEISLLSPPLPIRPEQVEIGLHGLLIKRGQQRGLLLPQVAVEHRFTVEQFLAETCRKAQLPAQAWRDADVGIFGFTCQIFADNPLRGSASTEKKMD